jgi:hypothetical protein
MAATSTPDRYHVVALVIRSPFGSFRCLVGRNGEGMGHLLSGEDLMVGVHQLDLHLLLARREVGYGQPLGKRRVHGQLGWGLFSTGTYGDAPRISLADTMVQWQRFSLLSR